jgi:membrane fusion protein, multidrug efflux system
MMKRLGLIVTVLLLSVGFIACGAKKSGDETAGENNPSSSTLDIGTKTLVTIKPMAYETFEHFFSANGMVEAVHDAFISSETSGQIKTIHVTEGQRVKKGQLLVSLNSEITESAIAEVKTGLELARTVYKKRKGLWDKNIGSEIQYLEAKTNKESLENKLKTLEAQLDMAMIKAPISGIVDQIFKKEGELSIPGVQLIRLVNLDKVYVNADVSETYLAKIKQGDMVEVSFPSYPGLIVETAIHRIGQVVKTRNRTFLVQVLLDNKDEKLKPNMVSVIKMKDFSADSALVVPSIIIKNDLKGPYLYVTEKQEDGKLVARKVYVTPGMSEGSHTMITRGLAPGQQVIIKGYNLVKNGMEVEVKKDKIEG